MQRNALNNKTVTKQVWFYFIRGTTCTRPGYAGTITNLQIVLILIGGGDYHEYSYFFNFVYPPPPPKSLLTHQATQKQYLPKFSYPKKSRNRKFQTPKNPSTIRPVTWNPEYPPAPATPRMGRKCVLVFVSCTFLSWSQKQATLQLSSVPLELQLNGWIKTTTDSCFDKQEKRF